MLEDIYLLFSEILKECFLFFLGTIKSSPSLNFLCYMGVTCINFYIYNNVYSLYAFTGKKYVNIPIS